MTTIEWKAEYETGEGRVDDQHRKLFDYVRQLREVITQVQGGATLPEPEVRSLLVFLDTYVNVHFAYEELCFALRGCPMAKANRSAHEALMTYYQDYYARAQAGPITLAMLEELDTQLSSWLVGHICHIDTQLRNAPGAPRSR